jgi:hypothetical protein
MSARTLYGRLPLARGAVLACLAAALVTAAPAQAAAVTQVLTSAVDVSGHLSQGTQGDADNERSTLQLAPGAYLMRLSWTLDLTAHDPSWLSELTLALTNSAGEGLAFSPLDGVNTAGSQQAQGVIDLVNSGTSFRLLADGLLNLEYFDSADDLAGAADGRWDGGTLRITYSAAVPEPGGAALLALALAGLAFTRPRARRRPAAA